MVLLNLVSYVSHLVCVVQPKGSSALTAPLPMTTGTREPRRGQELCCVCLSRLEDNDMNVRALPCRHEFHSSCIQRWFMARHRTCPVCRFSVDDEDTLHTGEEITEELSLWFSSFHAAGF